MKKILEPLAQTPGVRMALLVAHDGVPVVVQNASDKAPDGSPEASLAGETADSLAALAAGWLSELERSIGPLSWGSPRRVVLRAARGSIVMTHAPGALLLTIIDERVSPDEMRLPMEAAVARMERLLRPRQELEDVAAPVDHASSIHAALPAQALHNGSAQSRADTRS